MAGEVDLSGLANFDMTFGSLIEGGDQPQAAIVKESDGSPLMLKIADIEEDPNQPRTEFDLTDIRASIKANIEAGRKPIKTPISVKAHPEAPGKWILNDGARRFRSAVAEGLAEIPAFIDAEHDSYDQMVVNIQRQGHSPMEIALFIQRREAEGDKKGVIAKRLGKPAAFVSKHAALLDMAPSVKKAYDEDRCRDVEALYMLVKNFETYPDEIDGLCNDGTQVISKYTVAALLDSLKKPAEPAKPKPPMVPDGSNAGPGAGFDNPNAGGGGGGDPAGTEEATAEAVAGSSSSGVTDANQPGGDEKDGKPEESSNSGAGGGKNSDPEKIRKAIVQVRHDERPARLMLDRRAAAGLAWIKYDDDGHEVEIDIGTASLVAIVEGA